MPSRPAIKSAVQGAILAGAALFLALPACVVADDVTIVASGEVGGGTGDLSDPFGEGSRIGAGSKKTPTPRPGTKSTSAPNSSQAPTPTPPPIITRNGLASDFWVEQESAVTVNLHGVVASAVAGSKAQVWAVGDGGTILYSQDAGDTWVKQESGTTKDLYSIAYDIMPGVLLAGGADGTLLLTTDGGKTWSTLPVPVASGSKDPPGAIRQVDIWTINDKRKAPFISTDRFPFLGASNVRKVFEDESDSLLLPRRDRLTWNFDLTRADTPTRFSFYHVAFDRAYGLVALGDNSNEICESPICIGWPDVGKPQVPWRWRLKAKFDDGTTPEGELRDIATVPDLYFECGERDGEGPLAAFLATDKAIYRTSDYGVTWKRISNGPQGADRIVTAGRGRLVAVTPTTIWYATARFPQDNCPKGEPIYQWEKVPLAPGDMDVDLSDQFLAVVKSSDTLFRPAEMWIVGRGGRIIYRKAQ